MSKGWLNLEIQDLAVAHAAYRIATGQDVFRGDAVRARGGSLYCLSNGLCAFGLVEIDLLRAENVYASRSLTTPK